MSLLLSGNNDLALLERKPSDVIRYNEWTSKIEATYGSINNFVCQERLHWTPLPGSSPESGPVFAHVSPVPFANQDDYKILRNDWPYGLTPDITHLVVWLKNRIHVNEHNGDLTAGSRERIEDFVQVVFTDRLARDGDGNDRVLWFKNWTALQSVRGLEHVHILIRNAPEDLLEEWTEGRLAY